MAISFTNFDLDVFLKSGDKLDEELLNMARMAENCERYEDMVCFVRARVMKFPDKSLSAEERNLLSVAYKNVIGGRRASWRALSTELEHLTDTALIAAVTKYKATVEEELKTISHDVLDLLEKTLIPNGDGVAPKEKMKEMAEEKVFYLKMAGDYYRYLTESVQDDKYKTKTAEFYSKALDEAKNSLEETHPIRLGLALNFSVCKFEILGEKTEACEMAKEAFDDAISKLDQLAESDYKDSTLIMQLLRDNLTLWSSNTEADEGEA